MRERGLLLLLLATGLGFLASLYLPWTGANGPDDGWTAGNGALAALFALALVGTFRG